MPTKEERLLFDCNGVDLVDVIDACVWRVDPVRAEIFKVDEEIAEIKIVNTNKVRLPKGIRQQIDKIRNIDNNEANISVHHIVYSSILLWVPGDVHKEIRNILEIEVDKIDVDGLTIQDIDGLIKQKRENFNQIEELSSGRIMEKYIKEIFDQSVSGRLDRMDVRQCEVSAKISAAQREISGNMASKKDVEDIKGKLDILLNR